MGNYPPRADVKAVYKAKCVQEGLGGSSAPESGGQGPSHGEMLRCSCFLQAGCLLSALEPLESLCGPRERGLSAAQGVWVEL